MPFQGINTGSNPVGCTKQKKGKFMRVGLIGNGVTGGAVYNSYKLIGEEIVVVDKSDSLYDIENCEIVYICVPETELDNISKVVKNFNCLFVVRSTALPKQFTNLFHKYAYVPEFLTEKNANNDFFDPPLLPIGTNDDQDYILILQEFLKLGVSTINAKHVTPEEASLIKFYANSFLAAKVIFNNQFKLFCDSIDVNYNIVKDVCAIDERLGSSHWEVPGFHGYGYSGKCFPKDVKNLIENSSELTLLEKIHECNLELQKKNLL